MPPRIVKHCPHCNERMARTDKALVWQCPACKREYIACSGKLTPYVPKAPAAGGPGRVLWSKNGAE